MIKPMIRVYEFDCLEFDCMEFECMKFMPQNDAGALRVSLAVIEQSDGWK